MSFRKRTITPAGLLVAVFLAVIALVPLVQTGVEIKRGDPPSVFGLFQRKPTAANLRLYEHDLEDGSLFAKALRPYPQYVQMAWLKDGGEKALVGREGWLFYRPRVQALLDRPEALAGSSTAPEVLAAITAFRDDLARRGIHLLVVPVPNKESVYPEMVTRRRLPQRPVLSENTQTVLAGLQKAGVNVIDLFDLFARAKAALGDHQWLYLAQDSHWSELGLATAARAIADGIRRQGWLTTGEVNYETRPAPIQRQGDLLRMLHLPALERRTTPESIPCAQVVRARDQALYQDDPKSEILVLGDSFLRIFEADEPGSAGLIAHLGMELKRPLSSIVNDGGASTLVRQELLRRPTVLAGKKLVIWEFVERDLRLGTEGWQVLRLPDGPEGIITNHIAYR
jgi:hypothetical protein